MISDRTTQGVSFVGTDGSLLTPRSDDDDSQTEDYPLPSNFTSLVNRLRVPKAFAPTQIDQFDDVTKRKKARSINAAISSDVLDQLSPSEQATLNELLEERKQDQAEDHHLENALQYPMLSMQHVTNGLLGGFSVGCTPPIRSTVIEWTDLLFILQDVALLGVYGLAVSGRMMYFNPLLVLTELSRSEITINPLSPLSRDSSNQMCDSYHTFACKSRRRSDA